MKKITHTQLICWAHCHMENELRKSTEQQEKAKAAGADDLVKMMQKHIDELKENIDTLDTLYEIETGTLF